MLESLDSDTQVATTSKLSKDTTSVRTEQGLRSPSETAEVCQP